MHKNWVQVNLLVILFCIPILSETKSLLHWTNNDHYRDDAYNNHYWNSQPGFGVSYSSAEANQDDLPLSPTVNKQALYIPPTGYAKEEISKTLKQNYRLKESIIPKYETKPQDYDSYDSHQMWGNSPQLFGSENFEYINYKNPTTLNTLYGSTYGQDFKTPQQNKLVKGAKNELRSYEQKVKDNDYGKESNNYEKPVVLKMNFDKPRSVKNSGLNGLYEEDLRNIYDQNLLKGIHSTSVKKSALENGNKMKTEIVTDAVDNAYDKHNVGQGLKKEKYGYDDYDAPLVHKDLYQKPKREDYPGKQFDYDIVKRVHSIKLKKSALENRNKMKTEILTGVVDDDYDNSNVQDLKKEKYGYDDYDVPVVHKDLSQKQEKHRESLQNYGTFKRIHSIKLKKSVLENGNKMKTEVVTKAVDDDYDKPNVYQDLNGYDDYDAPAVHEDLSQEPKREDYLGTQYNYDIVKRVHSIKFKKPDFKNRNKMKTEIVTEVVDDDYDKPDVEDLKKEKYGYDDYDAPVVHKDLSQKQHRESLYNYGTVKRVHSAKLKKSALENGNKLKTEIVTEAADQDFNKPNVLQYFKVRNDYNVLHKDLNQKQKAEENHETKTMSKNTNKNLDTKTATAKPTVKNIILKRVKRWKKGPTIKSYGKIELPNTYYEKHFSTEKPNIVHRESSIFLENESHKYEHPNNYDMSKNDIPIVINKKLQSLNKCSMRKIPYVDCLERKL